MTATPAKRTRERSEDQVRRTRDFRRLWAGETVSHFGSQVTVLALPLTAVVTLEATAPEVGVLNAMRFAPFLVVSLLAGVYVDRRRRLPIMIRANLARALLVMLVPLAALLGLLSIELLFVVAFLIGAFTTFFDIAYPSYVPSLVGREHLAEANGRLEASRAAADIGGPGVGGLLVQLVTAPFALVVDAVSFVFSATALRRVEHQEPEPGDSGEPLRGVLASIHAGIRATLADPYVRPIAAEAATFNLFSQSLMTAFIVYGVRELELSAGALGAIVSVGAAGAFTGAAFAAVPVRQIGLGRTITVSILLASVLPLGLPLVPSSTALTVPLFALCFLGWGFAVAVYNVHALSVRQAVTPDVMLGRMNASYRFLTYGAVAVGALAGGFLGEAIGLRETLFVSATGILLSLAWIAASPVPQLSSLSDLSPPSTRPSS